VRLLVVSALASALVGCSSLTPHQAQMESTGYSVPPPPTQYDHAYTGKLAVYELTPVLFSLHCNYTAAACAFSYNNNSECYIYIKQGTRYSRASLMRHELGHCNGWRHPRLQVPPVRHMVG
jgi:hypothetical protein